MVTLSFDSVAQVLFGKARRKILSLLFTRSDQAFYLREISRLTGLGVGPVQRELGKLVECGILTRHRDGKQVYFRPNEISPVYKDLKAIIIKTVGVGDLVNSALAPVVDKISFAFIYGSFAKGTESSKSDIDLMVIGDVTLKKIVGLLAPAQKELAREINPSIFSTREFTRKLKGKNSFLATVLNSEIIMLVGDENELGLLG